MNLPGYAQPERDLETRQALWGSLTSEASRFLTICEQLRFIYDDVYQLPESKLKDDISEKLIEALNMGKKMNSRLHHYKRLHDDRTGSGGSHLLRLRKTDERRELRRQRETVNL